jgi:hypothetical protein
VLALRPDVQQPGGVGAVHPDGLVLQDAGADELERLGGLG